MCAAYPYVLYAPLISGELLDYALGIPPEFKQRPDGDRKIEKWIFRKSYEPDLPTAITWRGKQEFSQGSGSADLLPNYFENAIDDQQFAAAQAKYPLVRSKEEYYYFHIFVEHYGAGLAVETVGQWVSLKSVDCCSHSIHQQQARKHIRAFADICKRQTTRD